jgi:hypothetical protein
MVLVSKGNPRAAHTLSFLDFNGWEKKTLEFVLEPTVLKGRDLDPSKTSTSDFHRHPTQTDLIL